MCLIDTNVFLRVFVRENEKSLESKKLLERVKQGELKAFTCGLVLAGVVAGLYSKKDVFLSAQAGSYMTKIGGDRLFERVGTNFNASDLVKVVMIDRS